MREGPKLINCTVAIVQHDGAQEIARELACPADALRVALAPTARDCAFMYMAKPRPMIAPTVGTRLAASRC
jgi:hypothetical protein